MEHRPSDGHHQPKNFRQDLTNDLIKSLEESDGLPWEFGWDTSVIRPFNPSSGVKYKGVNVVRLLKTQADLGLNDSRWMTFKQANKAGYSIRKGAKSVVIEHWDWSHLQAAHKEELKEQDDPGDQAIRKAKEAALKSYGRSSDETHEVYRKERPRVFFSRVFNGADIVGLPEIKREVHWQPNELAEQLIAATGAKIEHSDVSIVHGEIMSAAYYRPTQDKIVMPPRDRFKSEGDYYATLLHELAHWTGHPSRLDRFKPDQTYKGWLSSPEYAREELRAEIASVLLSSMVGIQGRVQNHARYVQSWLTLLKQNKNEIFYAAREAEKIVDCVFGYAPKLREIVESRITDNLLPKQRPHEAMNETEAFEEDLQEVDSPAP
ncbi:MAG: zincin-like metallopeptidase domain-containing protein [Gammaproteobacteria bacterium]|nr:zincin-like metallopeptidase domain-containing protein [Gammaproteobacteria bacterium]